MTLRFHNTAWPSFGGGHRNDDNHCGSRPGGYPAPTVRTVSTESALAVSLAGGADAFGVGTLADAAVSLRVVDRGLAAFAIGRADFLAAAQPGGSAFASSYADWSIDGADLYKVTGTTISGEDSAGATMASTLSLIAIDLKFDVRIDGGETRIATGTVDHTGIAALDGNVAGFAVDAVAVGDNSLVDLRTDAFALEDEMSTVAVTVTAAVDTTTTYTEVTGTWRADRIGAVAGDMLVFAGDGRDDVNGGQGDDWIFGQDGRDWLTGGGGDDTLFGGDGRDQITAGDGTDWLFGGDGEDMLCAGGGDDLVFGNAGSDSIEGGAGNDLIAGGTGRDRMNGGDGLDVFLLGAPRGDDNDVYKGGAGADSYLLAAAFDRDVIADFSLLDGDRLVLDDWMCSPELDGIAMKRSACDAGDLVISFDIFDGRSELVLDDFFRLNAGYADLPRRGWFSDSQAADLLAALSVGQSDFDGHGDAHMMFQLGDMLSLLG